MSGVLYTSNANDVDTMITCARYIIIHSIKKKKPENKPRRFHIFF